MASKSAEIDFKIVPEKLEDITASWCQHILHEGSTIDKGDIYLQKCWVGLSSNLRVTVDFLLLQNKKKSMVTFKLNSTQQVGR